MSLVITPVTGAALTFDCNPNHLLNDGVARFSGYRRSERIVFFIDRYARSRLASLEDIAAQGIAQTRNRAGLIQLSSQKPCSFVRCTWDAATNRAYAPWSPEFTQQEATGLLEVTTASVMGAQETLGLTLWRGDWLWQDGAVERFV